MGVLCCRYSDGNRITLSFSGNALTGVHDSLDRDICIDYDGSGQLASVTDFDGRTVTYAYYQPFEAGGNPGDLKSVTDPLGQRTIYTYSTGFPDDRLNHNLLTITDAKGQTYLTNTYSSTTAPQDFSFDRVLTQVRGTASDIIDYVYIPQDPAASNNCTTTKTIINDAGGNVFERYYDERNLEVVRTEFSGRTPDPSSPTTETTNRPSGTEYTTRYEWNDDFLLTKIIDPNLNEQWFVYEVDLDPDAAVRSRANLRELHRMPGALGGDQGQIGGFYEYDDEVTGNGTNLVTRATDGRGGITFHSYDTNGNRIQTVHRIPSIVENWSYNSFGQVLSHTFPSNSVPGGYRRRDGYTYYDTSDPVQNGYLAAIIVDKEDSNGVPGLALATLFEYDPVGNIVAAVDPKGHDTRYVVNALNLVTREVSREVIDGSGIRYQKDLLYDQNNNLVQADVLNVDESGVVSPNAYLTTAIAYDILNHPTLVTEEVDSTRTVATEYAYDGNRNLTAVRFGEAMAGRQVRNTVHYEYDGRNLLSKAIRAKGDLFQSSTEYVYDGNGNVVQLREGIESVPRTTAHTPDGYDRLAMTTDAMGNKASYHYDANGNLTSERVDGELLDVTGSARLFEANYSYDAMDRRTASNVAYFDPYTGANLVPDGFSSTTTTYNDSSQVLSVRDDNGNSTTFAYDTANRQWFTIDPKGNTTAFCYDDNSNVCSIDETDKSDSGLPDQMFVTTYSYDNLDRVTSVMDNAADVTTYGYDSRNNVTRVTDPRGNKQLFLHDGLDRPIQTTWVMTQDGTGNTFQVDLIETIQVWDDSSRLVAEIDDNGNATEYFYDPLDRRTQIIFADGTGRDFEYDVHDNLMQEIDANGTTLRYGYDLLNRRIGTNALVIGAGVSGETTFEVFGHDGLSRLVLAADDDSTITRTYDSLANVRSETLSVVGVGGGMTTAFGYDGVGNELYRVYPCGRTIEHTFDSANQLKSIADAQAGLLTSFEYIGTGRLERRTTGAGVVTTFGYDNVRRPTMTKWLNGSNQTIDHRTYTWDPAYNKQSWTNHVTNKSRAFVYDSADRLIQGAASYSLDGVGNRRGSGSPGPSRGKVSGGPSLGGGKKSPSAYSMDPTPVTAGGPADRQVNQYTTTPLDERDYDDNGNLKQCVPITGGGRTSLKYDVRNRLVEFEETGTGVVHKYKFDALGRRIEKTAEGSTDSPQSTTRFLYAGNQVVEERDGVNAVKATYVRGRIPNELISMGRDLDGNSTLETYWYVLDDQGSVVRVLDQNGGVEESYEFGDFGLPKLFNGLGQQIGSSAISNSFLFQGWRCDDENSLYDLVFDAQSGKFISRRIAGVAIVDDVFGNELSAADNNPQSRRAPQWSYDIWDDVLYAPDFVGPLRGTVPLSSGIFSDAERGTVRMMHRQEFDEYYDRQKAACRHCRFEEQFPGFWTVVGWNTAMVLDKVLPNLNGRSLESMGYYDLSRPEVQQGECLANAGLVVGAGASLGNLAVKGCTALRWKRAASVRSMETAVEGAGALGAARGGLGSLGRAGTGRGVREVVGDAGDARKLFDQLRGSNPVTEVKLGVFTAPGANGGTVTFRAMSKSGPPTVDVHGIEEGIRKIKYGDR